MFETDECHATYRSVSDRGVEFTRVPEAVPGVHATFDVLYGNRSNVVEPAE
ncbi:hypothetical protein [Haloarchaeobius sp. TZWWS8]|uniref:hypothetical protein n=1 Tax=Haloarchaeobius sp. TZWWS8 TaxID=3446121 RepID=UPI003EBBC855